MSTNDSVRTDQPGETSATEKAHSYVVHLAVLQKEESVQRHRSNEMAQNTQELLKARELGGSPCSGRGALGRDSWE